MKQLITNTVVSIAAAAVVTQAHNIISIKPTARDHCPLAIKFPDFSELNVSPKKWGLRE
jgi:hypothetical protein